MPPTTSPEFDALHRALPEIPWLSNTGKTTPIALPPFHTVSPIRRMKLTD